jgi:hypothetical protein
MDILRSGYAVPMRLFQDSDDTVMIRWYKVDDDTPVFPGEHATGSAVYEDDYGLGDPPIGEVSRLHSWRPTNLPHPPGNHIDGDTSWFLDGIPAARRSDPPAMCMPPRPGSFLLLQEDGDELRLEVDNGSIEIEH